MARRRAPHCLVFRTARRPSTYTQLFGVQPYTWYCAQVRAHNFLGWGEWSQVLRFRTPETEPEIPKRPYAISTTPTTIKIGWDIPRDNGLKHEGFSLQWKFQRAEKVGLRKTGKLVWTPWRRLMIVLENTYQLKYLKPGTVACAWSH